MVKSLKQSRLIAQTSYLRMLKPVKMFGKSYNKNVKMVRRNPELTHCGSWKRGSQRDMIAWIDVCLFCTHVVFQCLSSLNNEHVSSKMWNFSGFVPYCVRFEICDDWGDIATPSSPQVHCKKVCNKISSAQYFSVETGTMVNFSRRWNGDGCFSPTMEWRWSLKILTITIDGSWRDQPLAAMVF